MVTATELDRRAQTCEDADSMGDRAVSGTLGTTAGGFSGPGFQTAPHACPG